MRLLHVIPFESVVAEHGAVILRVCRAVAGPNHADDAWSETFLAALTAYPDLAKGTNVQAWLVSIARRKAIDIHRARIRSRTEPTDQLPERPSQRQPGGWQRDLWEALGDLTERQQAAVVYHYIAGLPYREVATMIGGSTAAVRRAAADGIAHLRHAYAEENHK